MLINLDEIQPHKPLHREFDLDRDELTTLGGKVVMEGIRASFQFRIDPLGYLVHYKVRASAHAPCVRCSQSLACPVDVADWVSLRTVHPEQSHVVLDDSEMNVRFIQGPKFDMRSFVKEIIELELPVYPRHDDNEPECQKLFAQEKGLSQQDGSPFNALSKYLEK